jgi:uracil-DNA glycosylase
LRLFGNRRDQDFLRRQIDLINPDVIIGCGVQRALIWLLGLEPGEVSRISTGKAAGKRVHLVRDRGDGPGVILTRHPGRAPVNPKAGQSVGQELRQMWPGGIGLAQRGI